MLASLAVAGGSHAGGSPVDKMFMSVALSRITYTIISYVGCPCGFSSGGFCFTLEEKKPRQPLGKLGSFVKRIIDSPVCRVW